MPTKKMRNGRSTRKRKLRIKNRKKFIRGITIILFVMYVIISSIFRMGNYLHKDIKSDNKSVELKKIASNSKYGEYDKGTIGKNSIPEKDIALNVAIMVGNILEENNIKVVYTRTDDEVSWPSNEKEDLRARVKIAKDNKADMFVSIHCNANKDISFNGMEVWCRFPNTDAEKLAKFIKKELVNTNYTSDRGVKYENEKSLAVLKLNKPLSVLVELGFLSNKSDEEFITSEEGQEEIAQAIAEGILKYKL
ncbi:N-acetylmuramoyl-L-alanine amidase family protein [Clostridium sporogenes]|uniref:N-acetylmuramoyl-L-alanine amidase family protein n=1 Tax=Clostridium sporogenes TaxID=1509 RepID=UPI00223735D7|nr:N-acetylmuramoyl-L-alanine amidase [Clostridium sporogenes]MCW6110557.1 N-acetylmuramoyl-L-alanine amidase [Clostridium sporogenes]